MASQSNNNHEQLVEALNDLGSSIQRLKDADAWMDEVESLNTALGIPNVMDRDQHKQVLTYFVEMDAQKVVDLSKNG